MKQLSSGSGPDINDVPAGFNNYLFIEGVILQSREPNEGVWGICMYKSTCSVCEKEERRILHLGTSTCMLTHPTQFLSKWRRRGYLNSDLVTMRCD